MSHSAEKNPKGDPLGTSGFVGFLDKVKNERGTLWTKFALALDGFRIVSKKWTDQCEDCSLKKNRVTAIVGHFSLKEKENAQTKKEVYGSVIVFPSLESPDLLLVFVRSLNFSRYIRTIILRLAMKKEDWVSHMKIN